MIVVLAPYSRGEITLAALRLADLLLALGQEVRYATIGKPDGKIHPFWDGKLWRSAGDGLAVAVKDCEAVIHFVPSVDAVIRARKVVPAAPHVLVPSWHSLHRNSVPTLQAYDTIVAPCGACAVGLREFVFGGQSAEAKQRLRWVHFDAGVPPIRRDPTDPAHTNFCFVATSTVIDFCGTQVLWAIRDLLDASPGTNVTLLSARSWPEHERRLIAGLRADFYGRFITQRISGSTDCLTAFHDHDWAVLPAVRWDFGIMVMRAMSCGCPVITLDVPPVNELVRAVQGGVLVPCETREGIARASTAALSTAALLKACLGVVNHDSVSSSAVKRLWKIDQVGADFKGFWAKLLGLSA